MSDIMLNVFLIIGFLILLLILAYAAIKKRLGLPGRFDGTRKDWRKDVKVDNYTETTKKERKEE